MESEPVLLAVLASFVAEAVAVLLTRPQVAEVVGDEMWIVLLRPAPTSPKEQLSTPVLMVQLPPSAPPTVQLVPVLVGSVSLRLTLWAMPGPALLTTMVNPIVSPAETGLASLVLVTDRSGQLTVTEAEAELLVLALAASLVAEAEALLLTRPQLADEVVAFTEYDYLVINDELPAAVDRLRSIVTAERARLQPMRGQAENIVRTFQ